MRIFIAVLAAAAIYAAGPFLYVKTIKGATTKGWLQLFCIVYTLIISFFLAIAGIWFDVNPLFMSGIIFGILFYEIAKKYLYDLGAMKRPSK